MLQYYFFFSFLSALACAVYVPALVPITMVLFSSPIPFLLQFSDDYPAITVLVETTF